MIPALIRGSLSARAGSDSFQLAGSETCSYCHCWQDTQLPTILLHPFTWGQLWEHPPPLKAAKAVSFHPEQGPGARTGRISTLTQEESDLQRCSLPESMPWTTHPRIPTSPGLILVA